jgi:hypothetical protein
MLWAMMFVVSSACEVDARISSNPPHALEPFATAM